jgi:lipopolysaccharide/colanic/teichoic acid biosynthesis glycosyltransferase
MDPAEIGAARVKTLSRAAAVTRLTESVSPPRSAGTTAAQLASDLLPLCDWFALYGALWLGGLFLAPETASNAPAPGIGSDATHRALAEVMLAPFILYDPNFGRFAWHGQMTLLARSQALRIAIFAALALALNALDEPLDQTPRGWLLTSLALGLLLTALARIFLASNLSRMQRGPAGPTPCPNPHPPVLAPAPVQAVAYLGGAVAISVLAVRPICRWNAVFKKAEDLLIGGVATLLLLPVLAIIALAIKFNSPGPVLFRQRRHALNNREFEILKFRTMHWTALPATTALQQTSRNDERVTEVGRFLRASSLDELPQLYNVIRGQMSLVGPRPHAVDMRTEGWLGTEITERYPHRHRIKPGITGWSQVNGARGATHCTAQLKQRVDLDLYYIENWSLLLDLKILALTVGEVFKPTNAY